MYHVSSQIAVKCKHSDTDIIVSGVSMNPRTQGVYQINPGIISILDLLIICLRSVYGSCRDFCNMGRKHASRIRGIPPRSPNARVGASRLACRGDLTVGKGQISEGTQERPMYNGRLSGFMVCIPTDGHDFAVEVCLCKVAMI